MVNYLQFIYDHVLRSGATAIHNPAHQAALRSNFGMVSPTGCGIEGRGCGSEGGWWQPPVKNFQSTIVYSKQLQSLSNPFSLDSAHRDDMGRVDQEPGAHYAKI